MLLKVLSKTMILGVFQDFVLPKPLLLKKGRWIGRRPLRLSYSELSSTCAPNKARGALFIGEAKRTFGAF